MSEYSGLDFKKLRSLPLSLYLIIKRDSWINSMKSTEDGREVLKAIWRLNQKKADIKKIRKFNERRR